MKSIYQFSGPIRMIAARHGDMIYNQHCQWVGKALEYYGEYCEHEVQLFSQLLTPTDVVWEIGANTGSQSVALAKMVPKGAYVGFEPQIELFKILASNLCLNDLPNARCLNLALGDRDGAIELPPVDYNQPHNFGAVSLVQAGGSGHKVDIRKMDDLSHLPQPVFIKIDVEGMEIPVILGGANMIRKMRPTLYVENDRIDQSRKLIETLWGLDYDLYWHITPYFSEANYFRNDKNIYGAAVSINMIGLPREKSHTVNGGAKITDAAFHPLRK